MPQVTTNTQLDTINILQEASSTNATDYFLIQRGATSYKIKKSDIIIPINQISEIGSKTVLGNVGDGSAAPSEVQIDTTLETFGTTDNTLATSGAIKDYIDNIVNNISSTPSFIPPKYYNASNNVLSTIDIGSYLGLIPKSIIIEQRWITGQAPNSYSYFRANGDNYMANSINSGGGRDIESNTFQGIFPVNSDGTIQYLGYRSDGGDISFNLIGYYS